MLLPVPSSVRRLPVVLGSVLAMSLIGCPPGSGQGLSVIGIWRHDAGTLFSGQVYGEVWGLTLQEDGAAEVFTRDPDTGIVGNYAGTWSRTETGLIAQFADFRDPSPQLYIVDRSDASTLELRNGTGAASTFTRVQTVPDTVRRRIFDAAVCLNSDLPDPSSHTGLGFDYEWLWYKGHEPTLLYRINPRNGAVSGSIDAGLLGGEDWEVHAMQGSRFWMCYPSGIEVRCYTPSGVLTDSVNTRSLGRELNVFSAAYDPTAEILWLLGRDALVWRVLRIDSRVEPDVLLDQHAFDAWLFSMTWDHGRRCLWAVTGFRRQAVIRIDADACSTAATYDIPDPNVFMWLGVAAVNGDLFLLGCHADHRGVLYRVTP